MAELTGDFGGFANEPETGGTEIFPVQPSNASTPQLAQLTNQLYLDVAGVSPAWDTNEALLDSGTAIDPTLSAVPEACLAYNALRDNFDNATAIPATLTFPLEIAVAGSDIDTVLALNYIETLL